MLSNYNLLKSLCNEALNATAFILNRVSIKFVPKTHFELFKGYKSILPHMRLWGCLSSVIFYNPQENKLDLKTISGCFIRYAKISKGCRFYFQSHIEKHNDYKKM